MKYAVVKIQGTQLKVNEGERLEVSRLSQKEGEKVEFPEVLLVVENSQVKIGRPVVKEVKVTAKVIKQLLGPKLDIFKFKAKTGYRRKMGFRPQKTLIEVEKITL
jgi:large subunit ribosomal protein L21